MPEPRLRPSEQVVYDLLKDAGWKVLKTGWPDFLAEREGHVRFIEVKSNRDHMSAAQKRVWRCLRRIGIEVELVTLRPDGRCSDRFSADSSGIPTRAEEYKQALNQIARITDSKDVYDIACKALRGGPPMN